MTQDCWGKGQVPSGIFFLLGHFYVQIEEDDQEYSVYCEKEDRAPRLFFTLQYLHPNVPLPISTLHNIHEQGHDPDQV